ncbi:MAG: hypothetical protein COU46_01780 [Candidatus Niyogibacteria bacterium CG10_big_fil_rev_8_21_14_0_10_42_19]|uniref:DUF58 domain-containing protein n=1 Tax=Candidatus Niyogibacteria bacterium CG10_big_fil_rev_8_21_14_0_10_42_19 TaxID=1974725 RepID=A0A2H0THC1_9BACT|nr:MAG: hypothetical protein COU46_01780 [Candidatus Niyogibacteria bacterium CG10_big_fil_rev_8_21_14_0_10_42_19]
MDKEKLISSIEEIDYFFERLSRDLAPGLHKSSVEGSGFRVKGYDTIFNRSDFDQVDWNTTFASGSRIPLVKIVEQKSAITVMAIVDGSASMGFCGKVKRMDEVAKLAASIGYSAYKAGDKFGLILYDDDIVHYFEPETSRSYALEIGEYLCEFAPRKGKCADISRTIDFIPPKPSLIFWLGDFHEPEDKIFDFLSNVAFIHDVVPVIFWDSAEFERLPDWGFVYFYDPETNKLRPDIITPKRKERMRKMLFKRRNILKRTFTGFEIDPLFVMDNFKSYEVAKFFLERRNI